MTGWMCPAPCVPFQLKFYKYLFYWHLPAKRQTVPLRWMTGISAFITDSTASILRLCFRPAKRKMKFWINDRPVWRWSVSGNAGCGNTAQSCAIRVLAIKNRPHVPSLPSLCLSPPSGSQQSSRRRENRQVEIWTTARSWQDDTRKAAPLAARLWLKAANFEAARKLENGFHKDPDWQWRGSKLATTGRQGCQGAEAGGMQWADCFSGTFQSCLATTKPRMAVSRQSVVWPPLSLLSRIVNVKVPICLSPLSLLPQSDNIKTVHHCLPTSQTTGI